MSKIFSFLKGAAVALGLFVGTLSVWAIANEALPPGAITPVGDVLAKLGVKIVVHVATNAELKAYPYGGTVERDGFYAPGDGGAAKYVHSTSACSLNSGAGDNGAQTIDTGSGGTGCWNTDLSRPISLLVWGAKVDCATNDQPAAAAAVKALGTLNGGGTLLMPSRPTCSLLASTLSIQFGNIHIIGAGEDASIFGKNFATGNGIEVGGNPASSTYVRNVTVEHLSVKALVTQTSGALFAAYQARNPLFFHVMCTGQFYICHATDGTLNGQADTLDTEVSFLTDDGQNLAGTTGMCIGCLYNNTTTTSAAVASGATTIPLSSVAGGATPIYPGQYLNTPLGANGAPGTLSNVPIVSISGNSVTIPSANAPSAAIPSGTTITVINRAPVSTIYHHLELINMAFAEQLQNVGGLSQEDINTDFNYIGLLMQPLAGQQVSGVFSNNVAYDANGTQGILSDTRNGGLIYSNYFTNQWVASCGSPITQGIVPNTSASDCILSIGPQNTQWEMSIAQLHVSAAGANCINLGSSARDWRLSGSLTSCAFGSGLTAQGIISTGATHWSWDGTIGTASNTPGVYPQSQQYNVYLTGATNWVKLSGDLGRDASGVPIYNNATGTTIDTSNVIGGVPWFAYTPTVTCTGGGTLSSGSGQASAGRYQIAGSEARLWAQLTMGSGSTCAGVVFTLPNGIVPNNATVIPGSETAVNGKAITGRIGAGTTAAGVQYYDNTGPATSGAVYVFNGNFEKQVSAP